MKIHIYKNTTLGLERVSFKPVSPSEAIAMLRANPALIMRDAESGTYEQFTAELKPSEVLTTQEVAVARNFKYVLAIALVSSILLFVFEKIS